MQAGGIADVQAALARLAPDIKIATFPASTATAQQAADKVGCQLGQIVKSLGYMLNRERPILVLCSGDRSIDERKLAAHFGIGRKKIRMMTAQQCLALLGYAPGAVPPLALRSPDIVVHMDAQLQRYELVYAAGGAANALFPIAPATLQDITSAQIIDAAR